MNLKLLQSPSSTTGYSGPAHAEWKWLTSVASPFVVREEDLGQPGEVACTPAHISEGRKTNMVLQARWRKKTNFCIAKQCMTMVSVRLSQHRQYTVLKLDHLS